MRYLIKTNFHMDLSSNKFLIGSGGLRVGAVLADDATARFAMPVRQQLSEQPQARQANLGAAGEQDHGSPFIACPQPVGDEFPIREKCVDFLP